MAPIRHNPGGVFGNGPPVDPYPQYRPPPRPYDYSYSYSKPKPEKPKAPPIRRETVNMSEALWCDSGNHAFSAMDPDRQRFSQSKMVKDDEYGGRKEVTTVLDICGPCYAQHNLFPSGDAKASEIPQDESYLRGYKDGVVKGETLQ